jgi:flagellar protein FliO/FliZ
MCRRAVWSCLAIAAAGAVPDSVFAQVGAPGNYHGTEALSAGGVLQVITGLVVVLLLIFGVAWFARRFGRFQGMATEQLRLLGGIHLGQREKIVIVQAGDERLVVGVSPGCIRTLHVMAGGAVDDAQRLPQRPQSFLERLNQEIRKRMGS